jgi:hypothetical protein
MKAKCFITFLCYRTDPIITGSVSPEPTRVKRISSVPLWGKVQALPQVSD